MLVEIWIFFHTHVYLIPTPSAFVTMFGLRNENGGVPRGEKLTIFSVVTDGDRERQTDRGTQKQVAET